MRNSKGSILAITVGFMLIFSMLGIASMNISTQQSDTQEKQILSQKAFWLAEAGIQRAFAHLLINTNTFTLTGNLGEGSYVVSSTPLSSVRWQLDSTGTVNGINRSIQAIVGPIPMDAFNAWGDAIGPGGGGLDGHVDPDGSYEFGWKFTFNDIFRISEAQMFNMISCNPLAGINPVVIDGIIWIQPGYVKITNAWGIHSGIMIVNGDLDMDGGHFDGIIWVNGAMARINGDDAVDGAVFVYDSSEGTTRINGTSALAFDITAIDNAFEIINSNGYSQSVHNIISWKEV